MSTPPINRREFIKAASVGAVAALGVGCGVEPSPGIRAARGSGPNIVYLFADQLRAQSLGCMGNPHVKTPNIDALAGEGLLMTNAISCSPVCSPYRGQLMTGRYPHSNGVLHNDIRLPDDETTIGQIFQTAGYATGYIGKWHLAGNRRDPVDAHNRRGWDYWAVRNCSHRHFEPRYWLDNARRPVTMSGWEPDIQTDLAVEFITRHREQPFCLFVSYGPPHQPYRAPQTYMDRYSQPPPRRGNVPAGAYSPVHEYYAMTTSLDDCVGRIVRALADQGLERDTILCFTSDHGDMLGSQGHELKQRPWEESIRVPLVVRHPARIPAGRSSDMLLGSVDIMPTLLGMCGLTIPDNVQGWNHTPTLYGQSNTQRDAVFLFNVNHGKGPGTDWRGIRTRQWIYAYHARGAWIMHDLQQDPLQLHNLVDDPKRADRRKALHAQLEDIRREFGESMPLVGYVPDPARTA